MRSLKMLGAACVLGAASIASAQPFTMDWYTVDGGGAGPNSALAGGAFTVSATAGQPDTGTVWGGAFEISGGFWIAEPFAVCYANCDGSSGTPLLTPNDFQCYLNRFAAQHPSANCDNSSGTPLLTPNDFQCFLDAYAAGCS